MEAKNASVETKSEVKRSQTPKYYERLSAKNQHRYRALQARVSKLRKKWRAHKTTMFMQLVQEIKRFAETGEPEDIWNWIVCGIIRIDDNDTLYALSNWQIRVLMGTSKCFVCNILRESGLEFLRDNLKEVEMLCSRMSKTPAGPAIINVNWTIWRSRDCIKEQTAQPIMMLDSEYMLTIDDYIEPFEWQLL